MGIPPLPRLVLFFTFALVACTILGGCAAVVSKAPVGIKPAILDAEEWEGTWAGGEDAMRVQAIEPDDGVLQVSWIEIEDEKPEMKTMPVYIREGDEWSFANYRDPEVEEEDGDGPSPFYWGRIRKEKGRILIWPPDPPKFEALVKAGKLPGEITDGSSSIVLKKLTPGHIKMIESEAEGVLFLWDNPIILRRMTDD